MNPADIAIIFDTETTGLVKPNKGNLDIQPHIIELGACLVDRSGAIVDRLSQLLKPPVPISAEITKITGITEDDVKDAPTFIEYLPQLTTFFGRGQRFIAAHNAEFDMSLLHFELARASGKLPVGINFPIPSEVICTVAEFQHVFGRNARLIELYKHFVGKELAQTHRALDDVEAMIEMMTAAKFWEMLP